MNNTTNISSTQEPTNMTKTAIYQQYTETTAFVLPLYIITIIVGSIGNGIVVRSYQKDKKSLKVYRLLITNLAMADLILCALFTPILLIYRSNASAMLVAKSPICEASIFLSMLAISMMYAVFPLLAFHRKDVMLNPRDPKLSFKQVKKLLFWFWVACAAVALGLVGMAWSIFLSDKPEPKFYRCLLINTEIDAFTIYFLGYSAALYGVSIFVTVAIYCKIYKSLRSNDSGVNASADERHVTKMCFWLAFVYTACWTPFLLVQLAGIFGKYSEIYFNLHACSSGIGVIGSAVNPIVYASMDPYYRSVFYSYVHTVKSSGCEKNKVEHDNE